MESQFALAAELSKLIPLPKSSTILELARNLQKSGSDIVAEKDLVAIFGRNKLSETFENGFKEVVLNSRKEHTVLSKWLPMILEGGIGPTLQRAMQQREYFAMVVQLSMLCWVHDNQSLASALTEAMRRRLQEAPLGWDIGSIPPDSVISGVLKACQEQTSTYPWELSFEAVRLSLGIDSPMSGVLVEWTTLTVPILQASLDMLTAVQSFPEDRIIYIEGRAGVITIVVWAHCVLGLTASVHVPQGNTVHFGVGNPNIIIDMRGYGNQQICLLEAVDSRGTVDPSKGLILAVPSESESLPIEADLKYPVKGYGTRIIKPHLTSNGARFELAHVVTSIASCISQGLETVASETNRKLHIPLPRRSRKLPDALSTSDVDKLLTTARVLFDGVDIDENTHREYTSSFVGQALDELPIPPAVRQMYTIITPEIVNEMWLNLLITVKQLALLLLGLNTLDLSLCEQWPLGSIESLQHSTMSQRLEDWDGKKPVQIDHDGWYDLLGRMMLGGKSIGPGESCLISNWGWSLYMSSFGDLDPVRVSPGLLTVKNGVPSRNGERRAKVVDGPIEVDGPSSREEILSEGLEIEKEGQIVSPRCILNAEFRSVMVGTSNEQFVVSVRFALGKRIFRSGYREMHRVRWNAFVGEDCRHNPDRPTTLPTNTATFGRTPIKSMPEIAISLVQNNRAARWVAMLSEIQRDVLIVRKSCLKCTISEACQLEGLWLIVC